MDLVSFPLRFPKPELRNTSSLLLCDTRRETQGKTKIDKDQGAKKGKGGSLVDTPTPPLFFRSRFHSLGVQEEYEQREQGEQREWMETERPGSRLRGVRMSSCSTGP